MSKDMLEKINEPFVPDGPMPSEGTAYPKGYTPSDDEDYMNPNQLAYFKDMLNMWKDKISQEVESTKEGLKDRASGVGDFNDQASLEVDQAFELRKKDRARKLIVKIDEAIERIDSNKFGYCQETGDPIGIGRLLARPIATLCIEAKLMQEKQEKEYAS